jgi:hypothetical protein
MTPPCCGAWPSSEVALGLKCPDRVPVAPHHAPSLLVMPAFVPCWDKFLQEPQPSSTRVHPALSFCGSLCVTASTGMPTLRAHPRASPPSKVVRLGPVHALDALAHTRTSPSMHAHAHAPHGLASGRPEPELTAGLYLLFVQTRAHTRDLPRRLLMVYIRIKVQVDLQADKSLVVVKGPFFPQE